MDSKLYRVLPTVMPLEQHVYATTEVERDVFTTDVPYIKKRYLNAHCIIVSESETIEQAKQIMRDYLAEHHAKEKVLSITLDKE